jgi:nucleotide-binding universal stress UspA family protein
VLHVIERLPPNAELLMTAFLGYRDVEEFKKKTEAELITHLKQGIEEFCTEAANQITECRLMLDRVIVEPGSAVDRIRHHAATGDYDALVMGSRGHGLVKEALMGGTSRKVLLDCPIPAFIIPLSRKEATS